MTKKNCHVIDEEKKDGCRIIHSFATVAECESKIAEIEKTEPEKVHRGGFGIDAPEAKVNL